MTARKMKGAKQEAKRASGMSRRCAKCPFKNKYDCCPSEMHLMHCHEVFVEAFVKGAKWYKEQQEKQRSQDGKNSRQPDMRKDKREQRHQKNH